jgi:hypothetical protein
MLSLLVAMLICTLLLIVAVWAADRRESRLQEGGAGPLGAEGDTRSGPQAAWRNFWAGVSPAVHKASSSTRPNTTDDPSNPVF